MNARRITALVSLGLVGAVVVGLAVTSGDDESASPASPAPPAETPSVAEPPPTTADADVIDDSDVATSADADPAVEEDPDATQEPETTVDPDTPDLPNRGFHPPLSEIDGWLQSEVSSLEELEGKVVAVQFWTFGCSNCTATIPHMQDLYAKYGGDDFEIVGVHAPEFDFESDPDAIAQAAADLGVTWPIALDTEKLNFRAWQDRRFWPRLYLLDQDGNIRYDHIGEGAYDEIDAAVGALISEGQA